MLISSASGSSSRRGIDLPASDRMISTSTARAGVDVESVGHHLLAAAGVPKEHLPGVPVGLHVVDPDLEHSPKALLELSLGRNRVGERREVLPVALEETQIQGPLVVEMPVDDRLRDPRGRGDVVDAGALITALAEQPAGGLHDELPALRNR
jgi:hypothetical protein